MWEDKGTHWAWKGGPDGYCAAPNAKRIEYAQVDCKVPFLVAATVYADEEPTPINRDEINAYIQRGIKVTMP
jgi:hypothetical protein